MVLNRLEDIASAAKTFACGIYKNQPGALIPNPISDALHLVWDNFCAPPPGQPSNLPPPPAPPFKGGQCCGSYYNVSYDRKPNRTDPWVIGYYSHVLLGRIGAVQKELLTQGQVRYYHLYTECSGKVNRFNITIGNVDGDNEVRIGSVSPAYGSPDNCGDLPDAFPLAPPPPSGGYTSPPTPLDFNDGSDTNINFNFTPPVAPPLPIGKLPPIIINMIKPEANVKIPIEFNFDGTVKFGGGGDDDGGFNDTDRKNLDDLGDQIDKIENDFEKFKNDYNKDANNKRNKKRDPDDFEPPVEDKPPGTHSREFLAAVQINLTEIPANAKSQNGDGAPDVYYAGWFEWRRSGFSSPREPIHFKQSVFLAPEGVDGYAYTLYTGYSGSATEIINKEEVP